MIFTNIENLVLPGREEHGTLCNVRAARFIHKFIQLFCEHGIENLIAYFSPFCTFLKPSSVCHVHHSFDPPFTVIPIFSSTVSNGPS